MSGNEKLAKNNIVRNVAKKMLYKVPYMWAYHKDYPDVTRPTLKYIPRAITIPFRSFPNFIIAGVQKSGTTSLFDYICQHPNVNRPLRKEIHFWDNNEEKGVSWYKGHFPIRDKDSITGESTPAYLWREDIAQKIHDLLPDCKIIIILRNPVERSFSEYLMNKKIGHEHETFEFAIEHEKERLQKSHLFGYIQKSIYLQQVKRYYDLFDKNQILVLSYDDLKSNPESITQQCYSFLGLDDFTPDCSVKLNVTKNKETLSESTRQHLHALFKPHNKKLYDFLGENYGWDDG